MFNICVMNYPIFILFLVTLILLFWHFNVVKKEIYHHNLIVHDFQNKLDKQTNLKEYLAKQNSKINIERINFKISIIKNQIEILKQISINKESN